MGKVFSADQIQQYENDGWVSPLDVLTVEQVRDCRTRLERWESMRGGSLPAHDIDERRYFLGIFLVGAYQEILGDLHNLYGDTDALQIRVAPEGYAVEHCVPGDSIREVMHYVGYDADDLDEAIRQAAQSACQSGKLTLAEARQIREQYQRDLNGYTYLEPASDSR